MHELRATAELNILRSAVDSPDRMDILLDYQPDIFKIDLYKKVFEIFQDANFQNKRLDTSSLYSALPLKGIAPEIAKKFIIEFSKAAGSLHIIDLINDIVYQNNIEKARCMGEDIIRGIRSTTLSLDDIKSRIEILNNEIETSHIKNYDVHLQDINTKPMDEIFIKADFLKYGIRELDENLIGMFNGQLIVIASRPGLGKSSLAMQIAQEQKGTVYFISREMKVKKLYARNLSFLAKVESWKIEFKKWGDIELRRIMEARELIKKRGTNIIFNDKITDYKHVIKQAKRIPDLKLLIIDYIQLLKGARSDRRHEYIAEMTGELKDFANVHNIPILLLSQLNRTIEYAEREPELSDLKESGAIEQDADVVIFIWVKKGNTKELDEFYFKIAKNRDGKSDIKINTEFEKKYYRFGAKVPEEQKTINWSEPNGN